MIIAGWILALLGLAQVVYSGTLDVSHFVEGNRLLGIAPSIVADPDLVAQRSMIHEAGCATFLAGAIFLAAAYLKPAPTGPEAKSWTSMGAIAAGVLVLAAAGGFGAFLYGLHTRNADQRLLEEAQMKNVKAEATTSAQSEADRRARNEAEAAKASGGAAR
ncbi:hypothetical protein [Phenylobacterium sp.]|uniref:hypothetical protein n=1 Tax=Phenylobacterium sp. TaxID=1871053 RepID=UPI0035AF3F71